MGSRPVVVVQLYDLVHRETHGMQNPVTSAPAPTLTGLVCVHGCMPVCVVFRSEDVASEKKMHACEERK